MIILYEAAHLEIPAPKSHHHLPVRMRGRGRAHPADRSSSATCLADISQRIRGRVGVGYGG